CVALLYDTYAVFRLRHTDRIKGAMLMKMLHEMEDGVGIWSAWRGENDDQFPHPITQGEIASLYRRFSRDLRPKPLFELGSRETRGTAGRGYYFEQFKPWWAKYCPDLEIEDAAEQEGVVRQLHAKQK